MDKVKNRVRSLLIKQESSMSVEVDHEDFSLGPIVTIRPPKYNPSDPHLDAELLKNIPQEFYELDKDVSQYVFTTLLNRSSLDDGGKRQFDIKEVEKDRKNLKKQLVAVNRKISELILSKQPEYTEQLKHVTRLEEQLGDASEVASQASVCLKRVKSECNDVVQMIMDNSEKVKKLGVLHDCLQQMKGLRRTEDRLKLLLEKNDFVSAIHLCKEYQEAVKSFEHYSCIKDLSGKLQDSMVMLEEQLDVALSRMCASFDEDQYSSLHGAYILLNKSQTAIDQLHMHFTNTVHNRVFSVVGKHVDAVENGIAGDEESLSKKPYAEVCSMLRKKSFIACLGDLVVSLWPIMMSYIKMKNWHENQARKQLDSVDEAAADIGPYGVSNYVKQKLIQGPQKLWLDIEQKMKIFLNSSDIVSSFSYDEFIQILLLVQRFAQVGQEFSQQPSPQLLLVLKTHS